MNWLIKQHNYFMSWNIGYYEFADLPLQFTVRKHSPFFPWFSLEGSKIGRIAYNRWGVRVPFFWDMQVKQMMY